MQGGRKTLSDCDVFVTEFLHRQNIVSWEHASFLLGYYSHLLADAEFQVMIREPERVKAAWKRIKADPKLRIATEGYEETWDTIKIFINREERFQDMSTIEAEYLEAHPDSGFITEILAMKEFPDYIDYLPHNAIIRKIAVMGGIPQASDARFIGISRDSPSIISYPSIILQA